MMKGVEVFKNSETLCEFLREVLPDALDESHKVQGGLFVGTLDQKEPGLCT